MPTPADTLRDHAATVADLGGTADAFAALDSAQLTAATRSIATLRQAVDRFAALAAAEVARRSRHELGHQGLAQRAGFLNPIAMIQSVAQVGRQEAARMVEAGALLADAHFAARAGESADERVSEIVGERVGGGGAGDATGGDPAAGTASSRASDWRALLAAALSAGTLSLDAMDAIRRVLIDVTGAGEEDLVLVAEQLIAAASSLSPDQLFRRARQARDLIDEEGIARREKQQRDLRSVRTWWDSNGMHCGSWRLASEDGTLVAEAFAQILSPRRGGPRFIDPAARAAAQDLVDDQRTDEQISADAFAEIVRIAADADPGTLFGSRRPAVRVIVTADRLEKREGAGHIEGRVDSVSMPTIERQICDTGVIAIEFDRDGQCMNVGREKRLFTQRQRIGLALRDGGCLFPGCDRPPSYCEAHHIDPWAAAHGRTDIADGVLLCRRHHLLIHDNRWQVVREDARYLLRPPPEIDPIQKLIPMPSRSPVMQEIAGARPA